ncbi:hypothetical protein AKJ09_01883 [Labilithrix luteola]|uniref:Uncharacterized protein n=1 Tax=Labilithrix luteola TaxID=1391654 RepID=A0A0K1PQ44_9BACT|nr:hypothetical protein AKJ09_01883 [Labilithrix luteola]
MVAKLTPKPWIGAEPFSERISTAKFARSIDCGGHATGP